VNINRNNIPEKISKDKILIIEGDDDLNFFKHFMKHEDIDIDSIHFIKTEGSFNEIFINSLVKRSDFSKNVKIIGIIRDADENLEKTFHDVIEKFKGTNMTLPSKNKTFIKPEGIRVGIYIIGNNSDVNMLEDLCLKSIEYLPEIRCVHDFWLCLIDNLEELPHIPSKSKAQVYLATKPIYVAHIGMAAKEGYWDFNSNILDELRDFTLNFSEF